MNTEQRVWEDTLVSNGLGMWMGTYHQKLIYQHEIGDIPWEILKRDGEPFDHQPVGKLFNRRSGIANSFFGKKHTAPAIGKIKAARAKQIIPVKAVLCGHLDRPHYCLNMCRPCYRRRLNNRKENVLLSLTQHTTQ